MTPLPPYTAMLYERYLHMKAERAKMLGPNPITVKRVTVAAGEFLSLADHMPKESKE